MPPLLSVVLVRPSHPGNIGAVARVMNNMQLDSLLMVAPRRWSSEDKELALRRARNGAQVIEDLRIVDSITTAVKEASLVVATGAPHRKSIPPCPPPQSPQ